MTNQSAFNQKLHAQAAKRGRRVVALRDGGARWTEIGKMLGITPQRVQAIYKSHAKDKNKAA